MVPFLFWSNDQAHLIHNGDIFAQVNIADIFLQSSKLPSKKEKYFQEEHKNCSYIIHSL